MNLIVIAALAAVCGAAKLDRTYLPPASAQTAGGSAGALQTPFGGASFRSQGNQGLGGIPKGAYSNDFGGVVVDAAAAGTRAAGPDESGLGAPRPSYGSQASKVGDAAFRGAPVAGFRQFPNTQQGDEDSANAATNGNPSARFRGGNNSQGTRFQASSIASAGNQPSRFDRPSFSAEPVEAEKPNAARPNAEQDRRAGILRYDSEVGTDNYSYAFETDNGISAEENGVTTNGVQAQGGFSYTGDDGQTYSVTYTADENGYQPRGDHLPTPPPIPDAILKSLEKNAQEEAAGVSDDGSYDAQKYNAGSDYNESDNNNGRYNGGQSNKGSGNGAIAIAEAATGFANQNNVQSFQKTQNFGNARKENGFSQQSSQNGQSNNGFGNINGFPQSTSAIAKNNGNNAFSAAAQASGSVSGGFGQSFKDSFSQQKQGQSSGFGGQPTGNGNQFSQQAQGQGSGSGSQSSGFGVSGNNFGEERQEQGSDFGSQSSSSDINNFSQQTQAQSSKFGGQTSGSKFSQQTQQQVTGFGGQSATANNFGQQMSGHVLGLGAQSTRNNKFGQQSQSQDSGFDTQSTQGQVSGFGSQSVQSQASFGAQSFGNANKFGQQSQPQSSGFGSQRFGYLPPKQNGERRPQASQKVPETPSFNSQLEGSSQQLTETNNQLRPTKQPDTTLTTPFETPQFDSASQQASSQNGQFGQNQQGSQFTGQFAQASAQVQKPQSSFSRRPSNQGNGFGQFPQKGAARPQPQNFRQQNASNAPVKTQASAFATFNSQETSTSNYNDGNVETTTGVAYTDTSPTTETPVQFAQNNQFSQKFNQAPQNQFNQAAQGQFNQAAQGQFNQAAQSQLNQGSRNQNRPNQVSVSTQRPFSQNNFAQQPISNVGQDDSYYYKQPASPFRMPETSENNFQGASSGQFNRVTEQPNFNGQSSSNFPSSQQIQFDSGPNFQRQQSSTKYPRPPTLPATAPTSAVNTETEIPQTTFQGQFNNGVTQASASSFAANSLSGQFNGNSQRFPQRQQSPQFNSQVTQSFSKPQQTTAIPTSFDQQNQYDQSGNGFNQLAGAQTFGQRLTGSQQFGNQETTIEPTTEVPASTYEGEIYQYNKPAEVLPAPSQDPTPQGSEETPVQFEPKEPEQSAQRLSQFQGNQFSQNFGHDVDERGLFGEQSSQFAGSSATFKADDDTASSVAGKGEVFGGPREPPSFDEETGYHY